MQALSQEDHEGVESVKKEISMTDYALAAAEACQEIMGKHSLVFAHAERILIEMQDEGLSVVCADYYHDSGELNIHHIHLLGAVLLRAAEWGVQIKGSFHRGHLKDHGTRREYDGYEPVESATFFL